MYQALPLSAPLPSAAAAFDTAAVLKPLPPRNCPVNPCLRASLMMLAGMLPRLVMKMTSGFFCTACVTNGAKSAVALGNGIVASSWMPYWPTVPATMVPPSFENLSSLATISTPVFGCFMSEYTLMLAGIAASSPRLSRKTYVQGTVEGALQLGTMLIPVVLTARIGILRLSASGWTATAELDSVGPRRANGWGWWEIVCAARRHSIISQGAS